MQATGERVLCDRANRLLGWAKYIGRLEDGTWGPSRSPIRSWTSLKRQKSGHMESAKLCCRSHLAAELKLQDWSGDNNALRQKNSRRCGNL